jgi:hypothetical protein
MKSVAEILASGRLRRILPAEMPKASADRFVSEVSKNVDKTFGTRNRPREFLTAIAALTFCRESGHALWVRLPMYAGKFHIWPGGRKEFYPDKELGV